MFRVFVADNAHYMDRDEEYELGSFATEEEAVETCRQVVRRSFDECGPGWWGTLGADPYIVASQGSEKKLGFSARSYVDELTREADRIAASLA